MPYEAHEALSNARLVGVDSLSDIEMYREAANRMRLDGFTPLDWEE